MDRSSYFSAHIISRVCFRPRDIIDRERCTYYRRMTMALHPSYPICPKSFVSRKFARVGCRWRDDWFFSSSLRFTLHFSGTHARSSIVCVSFASWKMIIQGEEFSERRSMQRSCVTFFNIYFYFYSCKIDYTLSENETNSSLKIWPKISFHKDNQSWGNKNSLPLFMEHGVQTS